MAYANIRNISITNEIPIFEVFQRLRDFICKRNGTYDYSLTGIGWTLHDSSYAIDEDNITAGDWIVIKSTGEGSRDQIYIQIEADSTTYLKAAGYLYWNNTSHTGVGQYRSVINFHYLSTTRTDIKLSIWGDLDAVIFSLDSFSGSTKYSYANYLGKLDTTITGLSDDIGLITSAVSSGSDVSITVDISLPNDWSVDQKLVIFDESNLEIITIKTVNTSTKTITADLTNSYASGAKIVRWICYGFSMSSYLHQASLYPLLNMDGTYSNTTTLSGYSYSLNMGESSFYPGFVLVPRIFYCSTSSKQGVYGQYKHLYIADNNLSHHDTVTTPDSTVYRVFYQYGGGYLAVKEV